MVAPIRDSEFERWYQDRYGVSPLWVNGSGYAGGSAELYADRQARAAHQAADNYSPGDVTPSVTPVIIGNAQLFLGDCLGILPMLPKVDAVITDPPYGVGNFVQTTGRKKGRGQSYGMAVEWNDAPPPTAFFDLIRGMSRHRIIWGANFFNCFEVRGGAIIWDKQQKMPNFSKADIASCTHFQKTEIVRIPWTNFTVTHEAETDHPCERPVSLYEWCINYLPDPITSVLDPFMGSGSCGVAAMRMGRSFIGIERDPRYFDMARRRIEAAHAQGELFAEPEPAAPEQQTLLGVA